MKRRSFLKTIGALGAAFAAPPAVAAAAQTVPAKWTRGLCQRWDMAGAPWQVYYQLKDYEWAALVKNKPTSARLARLDDVATVAFQRAGVI